MKKATIWLSAAPQGQPWLLVFLENAIFITQRCTEKARRFTEEKY